MDDTDDFDEREYVVTQASVFYRCHNFDQWAHSVSQRCFEVHIRENYAPSYEAEDWPTREDLKAASRYAAGVMPSHN